MSNAAPGWYPVDGGQRYWDGNQWTDHFQADTAGQPNAATKPQKPAKVEARHPQADDADTLWSAVGKPLTQIGAGKYRLTEHYLFFEKGSLRTNAQQIPVHEIHDVDATQTMAQKARGVGTITLTVMRSSGKETVRIEDVPKFREGVAELNRVAHARRDAIQTRSTTQTINYAGQPGPGSPVQHAPQTPAAAPAAAATPSADDVLNQLERLGKLRDAGVVTADEFDTKKAELLARL